MVAIVHIGASKTATSTLQRNVFCRLPTIQYLGKPGPDDRDCSFEGFSNDDAAELALMLEWLIDGAFLDFRRPRSIIEKLKLKPFPVVYSNELLCNNKHLSFHHIAERLLEIFGPAEILVTVRDPQTAIPSEYLDEMLRLPHIGFSDWLDRGLRNPRRIGERAESLEQFNYAAMIEEFRKVFNVIHVLCYEDLIKAPWDFALNLACVLRADPLKIDELLRLPAQNPAPTEWFYRYRRLANRFPSPCVKWGKKLNALVENLTGGLPKRTVRLSQSDRDRIAKAFPYP